MFYDGACRLCSREVRHYRRIDKDDAIDWVDISVQAESLEAHQLSHADAMARLHVIDSAGRMQTGAAAFVALWSGLPYYRRLASVVRSLRLVPLLDLIYQPFARWRLSRRCNTCAVGE
jgi:predicted DCC family thiol-disulfide oxidoreductase YuxK